MVQLHDYLLRRKPTCDIFNHMLLKSSDYRGHYEALVRRFLDLIVGILISIKNVCERTMDERTQRRNFEGLNMGKGREGSTQIVADVSYEGLINDFVGGMR